MQSSGRGGYSPGKNPFTKPQDSPASAYNHTLRFGPAKKNHAVKIKQNQLLYESQFHHLKDESSYEFLP